MADSSKTEANQMQVSINLDTTPILYTDGIQMTANEDGVVLDILQRVGNSSQQRAVARIGMSIEHAKKVAQMLGQFVVNPQGMKSTGSKSIN
jgi:hypothetical protein